MAGGGFSGCTSIIKQLCSVGAIPNKPVFLSPPIRVGVGRIYLRLEIEGFRGLRGNDVAGSGLKPLNNSVLYLKAQLWLLELVQAVLDRRRRRRKSGENDLPIAHER